MKIYFEIQYRKGANVTDIRIFNTHNVKRACLKMEFDLLSNSISYIPVYEGYFDFFPFPFIFPFFFF